MDYRLLKTVEFEPEFARKLSFYLSAINRELKSEYREFDYLEMEGLLYPKIEVGGKEILDDMGKYGRMWLEYLCEHKPGMYRELLLSGSLGVHSKNVDELEFEMVEQIWESYIENYLVSDEDFVEQVQVYTIAQDIS